MSQRFCFKSVSEMLQEISSLSSKIKCKSYHSPPHLKLCLHFLQKTSIIETIPVMPDYFLSMYMSPKKQEEEERGKIRGVKCVREGKHCCFHLYETLTSLILQWSYQDVKCTCTTLTTPLHTASPSREFWMICSLLQNMNWCSVRKW